MNGSSPPPAAAAVTTPGRPGSPAKRPQTARSRLAFLMRPGWIGAVVAAIVFAVLCFTVLAPWQFSRNQQRSAQNAAIAAAVNAPAQPLDERLPPGDQVQQDEIWQQATATGVFLTEMQVLVRLRQDGAGQPASEVLTPLRLADGSVLLVDRGYMSIADLTNGQSPAPPPSGTVNVTGRLQPYQPDPLHRAAVRTGNRLEVYGISPTSITGLPGPVRGGFIQLVGGSPGVLAPISVPQVDSGPFLSYAWQWLVFGTMGLLAVGFFIVREFSDPREPRDGRRDADGSAQATRSREAGPAKGFDRGSLYDAP